MKATQRIPPSLLFQGSQCVITSGIFMILQAVYPVYSFSSLRAFSSKFVSYKIPAGNQIENLPIGGLKLAITISSKDLSFLLKIGRIQTPSTLKSLFILPGRQAASQFSITLSPMVKSMCFIPNHFFSKVMDSLIILLYLRFT